MREEKMQSFLIKKANIQFKVELQLSRSVKIEPHRCKPENLRLCRSIAQMQVTRAQLHMNNNKEVSPYTLLLSLFDNDGWSIDTISEV